MPRPFPRLRDDYLVSDATASLFLEKGVNKISLVLTVAGGNHSDSRQPSLAGPGRLQLRPKAEGVRAAAHPAAVARALSGALVLAEDLNAHGLLTYLHELQTTTSLLRG